jgi:hypothetical protein
MNRGRPRLGREGGRRPTAQLQRITGTDIRNYHAVHAHNVKNAPMYGESTIEGFVRLVTLADFQIEWVPRGRDGTHPEPH